jgi:mRNA interferase MazF
MIEIIQELIIKLQSWNAQKIQIQTKPQRPFYFNEGEVWWCRIGENIGDEENGKGENFMRPVGIIRKFNKNLALVFPISSKLKDSKYYFSISYKGNKYSALVSQIKVIDTKRLTKKISQMSDEDFQKLKEYFQKTLF